MRITRNVWEPRPGRLDTILPVTWLDAPVLVLTGLYRESLRRPRTRATEAAWWGVALALVAAFGVLQIWISQNVFGWAHQILLIFSVLAEVGLLWICNQAW